RRPPIGRCRPRAPRRTILPPGRRAPRSGRPSASPSGPRPGGRGRPSRRASPPRARARRPRPSSPVRPALAGPVAVLRGAAPLGDRPRDGDGCPDVRRRLARLPDVFDAREHGAVDAVLQVVLVTNPLLQADRTDYPKYRRIVKEALVGHRPDAVPQAPRK